MKNPWRIPFVIGSVTRLAYGAGMMLAPGWMAGRLAPVIHELPGPRMNLRGMGGTQTGVALYTLAGARTPERARALLGLNALVDALDTGVSLLERRDRGRFDRVVAGGIAVNVAALACWTAAALTLRDATRGLGVPSSRLDRPSRSWASGWWRVGRRALVRRRGPVRGVGRRRG
jgi:hypothetical protein